MVSKFCQQILIAFLFGLIAASISQAFSPQANGTHTFGQRINNDRLLYQVENLSGNREFFSIKYSTPKTACSPIINYIEIAVTDIFNETHPYISSGGIGYRSVVVVITTLHNKNFSFKAQIYGI